MEGRRFLDGTYYGALKDGLREGRGTFIWDDGRRYAGGWLNDKMHGTGSLFDAEGNEIAYAVWYAGEIIYNIGDSWREHSEKKSRRFALLIGNCDYPERKLNNCLNDANALSKKLNILGFDTTLVGNATKSHIVSSVQRFTQKAKGAEAALFFFSGHGVSFLGKTYMVPIDCSDYYTIDSAFVCIDDIVNMLDDVGCDLKIAIIDACRVNPTKNLSKGLYDTKARNVLFAYATSPGYEAYDGFGGGTHSPYIDVIIQLLEEPRLSLSRFFEEVSARVYQLTNGRQQPFIESSLIPNNDFFFKLWRYILIRLKREIHSISNYIVNVPTVMRVAGMYHHLFGPVKVVEMISI